MSIVSGTLFTLDGQDYLVFRATLDLTYWLVAPTAELGNKREIHRSVILSGNPRAPAPYHHAPKSPSLETRRKRNRAP